MSRFSRRSFLKAAGGVAGTLALHGTLRPDTARAHSGTGHNLLLINLVGGCDGLALAPYYAGSVADYINSTLRPTLQIAPDQVLQPWAQTGIADKIGLHPSFQPLVNVSNTNLCVIQGVGVPNNDRSHNSAQTKISLGTPDLTGTETRGVFPRLMDHLNMDMLQFWALSPENSTDTNTSKVQPVVVYGLDSLGFGTVGWESNEDRDRAVNVQRALLGLHNPSTPVGQNYASGMVNMHDIVGTVQNEVTNQQVGNNSAGNYSETWFGQSIADIAKVMSAKGRNTNFGQVANDSIFMTTQHGYDTHNDQANPGQVNMGIAHLFSELASNLAVLATDLQGWGMWNDTTILCYTEFGRTNAENSATATAGTDHGDGGVWFALGGMVNAGVHGVPCTLAELGDQWTNAQAARIDYRDVFSDVIRSCFGVDGSILFSDHAPQSIGMMKT